MSICPIWNFTLYVTQCLHFFENHPLTDFTYLVPPSCLCGIWLLRDDSNSKTRVRFVYVLPEVLHGDFLSEIKYLFNLEGNILEASYPHDSALTKHFVVNITVERWDEFFVAVPQIDINWFHLLSPAILSLWYSRFEVTWLLRDDSNSKTRVRFVYVLPNNISG
jgi:hypothetical protein